MVNNLRKKQRALWPLNLWFYKLYIFADIIFMKSTKILRATVKQFPLILSLYTKDKK
jgi:hypothetical protein